MNHLLGDGPLYSWFFDVGYWDHIRHLSDGAQTIDIGNSLPLWNYVVPCLDRSAVKWLRRGPRENLSPFVDADPIPTREVTVVISDGALITLWAGPVSPKEPTDPNIEDHELMDSLQFWSTHAFVPANDYEKLLFRLDGAKQVR